VNDWAEAAGCSRSWLEKCIKKHIGKTPNAILREERYKRIQSVILKNPDATAAFVAGKAAPGWSERRLYNFLSDHYGTNFTKLRYEILHGES